VLTFFSCLSSSNATSNQSAATQQREETQETQETKNTSLTAVSENNEPQKIQEAFQAEFIRQLSKAGSKAEGWALFSDSGMGHNGQRWMIKSQTSKKISVIFCLIKQGETACKSKPIATAQFQKILPHLTTGDGLPHILPPSFDGINFEYLHVKNASPDTHRVVFKSSATVFPEAYENLIKAFNH
jgi:hypothetical protein